MGMTNENGMEWDWKRHSRSPLVLATEKLLNVETCNRARGSGHPPDVPSDIFLGQFAPAGRHSPWSVVCNSEHLLIRNK